MNDSKSDAYGDGLHAYLLGADLADNPYPGGSADWQAWREGWLGVPKNVFVIGTMNTADRSIAFLDVALRRRFKFIEMMPEYQLVRDRWKQNGGPDAIDPAQLLEVINARIELLYDRVHQIGHSFFLEAKSLLDLRDVFCGKVNRRWEAKWRIRRS